ncbi:MAG: hypothetical protein NZ992_00180 [Candidatus Korarchaeum sp.]|nr:hypothetical protein [Candidatus Korarchaeum sp.]MDW8093338.1 hypothetical protein [Nitrososphaerota archaeon]
MPIGKYSEDIVLGLLVRVIANLQGGWRIQKHERHRDPYDLLLLGPKKRVYTIEVKSTTKVVIDRLLMEEISRAQRRCDIVILYVFPFKAGYIFFPGERKLYKLGHGTLLRRLREIEACRAMQRQIEEKLEEARVSEVEDGERGDEDVGGDVSVPE